MLTSAIDTTTANGPGPPSTSGRAEVRTHISVPSARGRPASDAVTPRASRRAACSIATAGKGVPSAPTQRPYSSAAERPTSPPGAVA